MPEKRLVPVDRLRCFMEQAFILAGVPEPDGEIAADGLLSADLKGIGSHGVIRFPVYLRRLKEGLINPCPNITISSQFPAAISIDGDNGLGSVVMMRALKEGIYAAEKLGLAAVGVKRSNHFGAAGYYCSKAAEQGYVTFLVSNGPPALPPWGGREPYFGTNPIAFGIPRAQPPHVIVDMATSIAARGKIIQAAQEGQPIPSDWALDRDGNPTTDAKQAMEGVILPMAGPKGYALSLMVEHLAGVLPGAGFGREVAWLYSESRDEANVGHMLIVLRPDVFGTFQDYIRRTERFFQEIHSVVVAPGYSQIRLPGERGWELEQARRTTGIEISAGLAEQLAGIAQEMGLGSCF